MHMKKENGACSLLTKDTLGINISADIFDIHAFIAIPFILVRLLLSIICIQNLVH